MNYEEKYNAALERMKFWAKGQHPKCFSEAQKTAEFIFPELKESEDERIRKDLIEWFEEFPDMIWRGHYKKDILAWLEKQVEKDPCTNCINDKGCVTCENGDLKEIKAEPKFKVGDWVVRGKSIVQISDIQGQYYIGTDIYGNDLTSRSDKIHLWTLQDAKNGDVLVNGSNIFIFRFINYTRLIGYCHVNIDDGRFYNDIGKNECFCLIDAEVTPATKKQRDLLFQKLKEAGYEWDGEKKELKKIMQSSAWNEEDENFFNDTVAFFEYKNALDCRDWLKSLKQRLGG